MSTLYQTLGLPEGADRQQVKTAFRKLARCFHPDTNASDATAEQRFKELSAAYRTLMDPEARAAYDRALVERQAWARRRRRQLSTTAAAAGALSVSLALIVLSWTQRSPSPRDMRSGDPAPAAASAQVPGRWATWSAYGSSRFHFALEYPADVFAVAEPADDGALLTSADGRVKLRIFAARNVTGTTLASYRRFLLRNRYAGVSLEHTPQSKLWFVLSGTQGDDVIYEHVGFSCDGATMHGWQMVYPARERTFYDLVADEIHRRTALTSLRCGAIPPLPLPKPQLGAELPEPPRPSPQLRSGL